MSDPEPTASYLNDVYLGAGRRGELPEILASLGIETPLVVTDQNLIEQGVLDRLPIAGSVTFADVRTNPTESMAAAGAERYRNGGCDGLVSLGGGSVIDVAKGVAMLVTNSGPLEQYAHLRDGSGGLTPPFPPHIAIPTTAGSGSEVGRAALFTMASGEKLAIITHDLVPDAAICDPELTATLPPRLAAATGMDAVSHCVETFCSPRDNPTADALALDGFERGYATIEAAAAQDSSMAARHQMMITALHGALAFQKGLGAVHSLSHALGALEDPNPHHGTLNAIFLPPVLEFNAGASPEKFDALAERAGLADGAALPRAMATLLDTLPLPTSLRELGLKRPAVQACVEAAHADHSTATNPRSLDPADLADLYTAAF